MSRQNLFALLTAAALGTGLGFWLGQRPQTAFVNSADSSQAQRLSEAQQELLQISRNEYQDYLKTKDLTERSRKADALLSQVMLLFLADLGVHAASPLASSGPAAAGANSNAGKATSAGFPAAGNGQSRPRSDGTSATEANHEQKNRGWIKAGLQVMSSRNEKDASQALGEAEVTDLFSELKSATALTAEQLQQVNGSYSGEITFFDGREPWHVEWHMNGHLEQNKLTGQSQIILAKNGKVFSNSNGTGDLKNFSSFAGDPNAILLNAYDNDGYMQLYPVDHLQRIVGNFYLKKNLDQFDRAGTVSLQRD